MKHRQDNTFVIEWNGMPYHLTPEVEPESGLYDQILAQYQNNPNGFDEEPEPAAITNDTISAQRAARYAAEIDPLTAEYARKEKTGDLTRHEAKALKAQISAAVQQIKDDPPYLDTVAE